LELILNKHHLKRRDEFRLFAEHELDMGDHFPRENLSKAGQRGYMGLPIPRIWNGQGEDFLTYIIMIEEISRICASTGVILSVHTSVGTYPLLHFGTSDQKERYLSKLAGGQMLGAFALTEAGAGSDAAALVSSATAVDGGYLLNGCKLFITGGGEADLITVFATLDRSLGHRAITAFLVEKNQPGLVVGLPERKMGLARSKTTTLQLEDLFVPTSNRLGAEKEGFRIAMSLLDGGRIGIAAQGLGLAQAALDFTVRNQKLLESTGIKTNQSLAFVIAELATKIDAARLLVYRAAVAKESGKSCTREASMAKLFATDLAMEATTRCFDLLHTVPSGEQNPLHRYFCDAKATQIYEGTNQIQRIVIARELLK
jgi:acyl-CoA dehydrogenase